MDLKKCKAIGMNDYIAKPIDERILYDKIIELIKQFLFLKDHPESLPKVNSVRFTDLAYLHSRTRSNPKLMLEMIVLYMEQTPTLIMVLKKTSSNQDWNSMKATAHKLIPSFSIVGINKEFENMAKKLVEYSDPLENIAEVKDLVAKLEMVCLQAGYFGAS